MRWMLTLCVLVGGGCGDDNRPKDEVRVDATTNPTVDAMTTGDASALTLECASYCTAVLERCDDFDQYEDEADCMTVCAAMPLGTLDDTQGNTRGCRVYHTEAALADAALHCPHAGPSGGGQCGTTCDALCAIIDNVCTLPNSQYNACASDCAALGDLTGAYDTDAAETGDTAECRLYHATTGDCANAAETTSTACQ